MEVLGCSRAVTETEVHVLCDLSLGHVVSRWLVISIAELQESLDTTGGVLWAGSIVTVRQEHNEA